MGLKSTNFDAGSLASLRQSKVAQGRSVFTQTQMKTGKRITSPKDDASGLSIATGLKCRVNAATEGIRNLNETIAAMGIAESTLTAIADSLSKLKDLGVRAATSLKSAANVNLIQKEVNEVVASMDSAVQQAEFNGVKLLTGGFGGGNKVINYGLGKVTLQIGCATLTSLRTCSFSISGTLEVLSHQVALAGVTAGDLVAHPAGYTILIPGGGIGVVTFNLGNHVTNVTLSYAAASETVLNAAEYNAQISKISTDIATLSALRGNLGAMQVKIDALIASTESNSDKTEEARALIEDIDMLESQLTATRAQAMETISIQALALSVSSNYKFTQSLQQVINLMMSG